MPRKGETTDHRIMLHSGSIFDLANPEASEIKVEDIAHGLAHTCRFAGQCKAFYSVAEHSVLVSQIVLQAGLAALFHDAAEAFVGDMSRPLKQLLPEYNKIEKRIERTIFHRFGIEWPAPAEVKTADYSVMAAEQRALMPPGTNEWLSAASILPAHVEIRCLHPQAAKAVFLDRYAEFMHARRG
jgi:uncharacterized protein